MVKTKDKNQAYQASKNETKYKYNFDSKLFVSRPIRTTFIVKKQ